jgi:hypothetical protein
VREHGVMLLGSMRAEGTVLAAFLLNLVQRLNARSFLKTGGAAHDP